MRVVTVGLLLALFLGVAPLMASHAPALVALLSVAVAVLLASYVAEEASAFALICGAVAALGYALPVSGFVSAALFVGAVFAPRAVRAPVAWAAGLSVALGCAAGGAAAVLTNGYAWAAWESQTWPALVYFLVAILVGALLCMVPFAVVADDAVADLFKRQALAERGAFRVTLLRALALRRRFAASGGAAGGAYPGLEARFEGLRTDLSHGLRTPPHQGQAWREALSLGVRELERAMQHGATQASAAGPAPPAQAEEEVIVELATDATAAVSSDPA